MLPFNATNNIYMYEKEYKQMFEPIALEKFLIETALAYIPLQLLALFPFIFFYLDNGYKD